MTMEKLLNRVYDLVKEAEDIVDHEVQLLTVVARMAETAEHIYELAARLDRELRTAEAELAEYQRASLVQA